MYELITNDKFILDVTTIHGLGPKLNILRQIFSHWDAEVISSEGNVMVLIESKIRNYNSDLLIRNKEPYGLLEIKKYNKIMQQANLLNVPAIAILYYAQNNRGYAFPLRNKEGKAMSVEFKQHACQYDNYLKEPTTKELVLLPFDLASVQYFYKGNRLLLVNNKL